MYGSCIMHLKVLTAVRGLAQCDVNPEFIPIELSNSPDIDREYQTHV